MEVRLVSAPGVPEESLVSVRIGPRDRRQGPASASRPLRFGRAAAVGEVLKVDLLERLGGSRFALGELGGAVKRCSLVLGSSGDTPMTCELEVARAADADLGGAMLPPAPVSSAHAQEYLLSTGVLQSVRDAIMQVIRERPGDPYEYVAETLRSAPPQAFKATAPGVTEIAPVALAQGNARSPSKCSSIGTVGTEVRVVSSSGIPPGALLSVRAGLETRRQGPFAEGRVWFHGVHEGKVMKVDILRRIGGGAFALRPPAASPESGDEAATSPAAAVSRYHFQLPSGAPCELEVAATSGAKCAEGILGGDAASTLLQRKVKARKYLDSTGLMRFVQSVMELIVKERPLDPISFAADQFLGKCLYLRAPLPPPLPEKPLLDGQGPQLSIAWSLTVVKQKAAEKAAEHCPCPSDADEETVATERDHKGIIVCDWEKDESEPPREVEVEEETVLGEFIVEEPLPSEKEEAAPPQDVEAEEEEAAASPLEEPPIEASPQPLVPEPVAPPKPEPQAQPKPEPTPKLEKKEEWKPDPSKDYIAQVHIMSAEGLRERKKSCLRRDTRPDPFVVCIVIKEKTKQKKTEFKTEKKKDTNPKWDHPPTECLQWEEGDALDLRVWSKGFFSDDLLGSYTFDSKEFFPHGFDDTVKLEGAGPGVDAKMRVKITIKDYPKGQKRPK